MQVALELQDTTSFANLDREYLKKALVATLYRCGQLSEHEACVALGLRRRDFEELLPQFGFSVLADDQATLDAELHA